MDYTFSKDLFFNMSILLSASILFLFLYSLSAGKRRRSEILIGLSAGMIGILLLANTVHLNDWIVFDTRSILVSITALFFGPVPVCIAAPMIIAYRIFIGGIGAVPGVLVTLVSAAVGLIWRLYRTGKDLPDGWRYAGEMYFFGVMTHILMLLCMFSLPIENALAVLRAISLPVMAIFPLGTVLLGMILGTRLRQIAAENALREREAQLQVIYDQTPAGIALLEGQKILRANRFFTEITGISGQYGTGFSWEALETPEDTPEDRGKIAAFRDGILDQFEAEKYFPSAHGNMAWLHLKIIRVDHSGTDAQYLCMVEDVTERKRKDKALLDSATRDRLTGAYSRAYLDLERTRLELPDNLPVSLLLCDVDGLKLINNAFGHEEGDVLLRDVAEVLMGTAREQDMVVRYGGDEFLVIMPRTGEEEAHELYGKVSGMFEDWMKAGQGSSHHTSVSIGCATRKTLDVPLSDTMRIAEEFLFTRKLLTKKSIHSAVLSSIKATLFEKSYETEEHCERMSKMARELGEKTGLSGEHLDLLELGAFLHDIGKVRIDVSILKKPGKLTEAEWEEIKKHPEAGYRIALSVPELHGIAEIILFHHEHWDGSGYPRGLSGENIPLLARVISLVDAYDAMTAERSYRPALSRRQAAREIRAGAGSQFDPHMADIFIENVLGISPDKSES